MSFHIPASMYRDSTPPDLTDDQEALKLDLFNKIAPKRRKFIERIGYENWDPFQKPNDPMDIRKDVSKRTTQELVRDFLQSRPIEEDHSNAYRQGALEFALGVISRDEKFIGYFDFALWYYDVLLKEGHMETAKKTKTTNEIETANKIEITNKIETKSKTEK